MAVSSAVAKQLCTKAEMELFTQSLSRNVKSLTESRLKSKVARSRKLRDKYRQLANRQEREARGKQPSKGSRPSQGSQRTRKKEQLFAESLERFEKQLGTMNSAKPATKKTVNKKAVGQKTATKKTVASKKATAKKAAPARQAAKKRAAKKKTIPKRKVAARGGASPGIPGKSKKAATSAKRTRVKSSGRVRKTAHLSSQGRRKQTRRDSR